VDESICKNIRSFCEPQDDSCTRQLIVTVGHSSDLKAAKASLDAASIAYDVAADAEQALLQDNVDGVAILVQSRDTIREILQEAPAGATVYVIDSCWNSLKDSVPLFGDFIPRRDSIGKCVVPDRNLSLCLADWASHPTQHGSATMNPWTRLLSREEFSQLMFVPVFSVWD